jgi:hypothetical protein
MCVCFAAGGFYGKYQLQECKLPGGSSKNSIEEAK